jgi:hypothetical protein
MWQFGRGGVLSKLCGNSSANNCRNTSHFGGAYGNVVSLITPAANNLANGAYDWCGIADGRVPLQSASSSPALCDSQQSHNQNGGTGRMHQAQYGSASEVAQ